MCNMAACQKYASANKHETRFCYAGTLSCCPTGVLPAAPVPMLGHHWLFTLCAVCSQAVRQNLQSGCRPFDFGTIPAPVRSTNGANSFKTKRKQKNNDAFGKFKNSVGQPAQGIYEGTLGLWPSSPSSLVCYTSAAKCKQKWMAQRHRS